MSSTRRFQARVGKAEDQEHETPRIVFNPFEGCILKPTQPQVFVFGSQASIESVCVSKNTVIFATEGDVEGDNVLKVADPSMKTSIAYWQNLQKYLSKMLAGPLHVPTFLKENPL